MNRLVVCTCCSFLIATFAGCGDGKASVQGAVTFDGQPVKAGSIVFVSTEPLVREGAPIVDGTFKTRVPPGTYKIELNAKRVTGTRKQKGFDGREEELELTGELFPERYNAKSELTEVIKPGNNTITLDLKSKK